MATEIPVDKRKARRFYRRAATQLINAGTFLNTRAPVGSIPWTVASWYRRQARFHRR